MEKFCLCLQTLIPVRFAPSETAEMLTQVLFGEQFKIIEYADNWANIKIVNDGYEGWIDKKLAQPITDGEKARLDASKKTITNQTLSYLKHTSKEQMQPIIAGSELYISDNNIMQENYALNIDNITKPTLMELALQFVNAPYLWGGKSILGIDCSGLMQVLYKTQGIQLPRDAFEQVKKGNEVSFIHNAKLGDLAFFDNNDGKIIHVGMFLNSNTIIHASGHVRIDPIDHQGIYKTEDQKYSHKLRIIKRIIS